MSEPVSPLGNARHQGQITVEEIGPLGMITLRGDLASVGMATAANQVTGLNMPATRGAVSQGGNAILWMSPDELLVLCPYDETGEALEKIEAALMGQHALAVNVSDARAVFRLSGQGLREVLAKLTPADLSPEGLPVGELRRTRLGQVAAAFWLRTEDEAQVICFRSVADYAFGVLKAAAQPASVVGYF